MDYDAIFKAYYTQFRLEADTPTSEDDEYIIGMELANEAIDRWAMYDGVYWRELFTTLSLADETVLIEADTFEYDTPDDFKEAGGFVVVRDSVTNAVQARFPIVEPQEAQFLSDNATYCFFTGNPGEGYVLHLNPVPGANLVGCYIDYVYYKQPTKFTTGSDTTEMSEPYFIVHRILSNRFRGSSNPYFTSARNDAEDVLKIMKMSNDSGNWANPWKLPDNSGAAFGVSIGPGGFFN